MSPTVWLHPTVSGRPLAAAHAHTPATAGFAAAAVPPPPGRRFSYVTLLTK